jgi:hypothetical protein
VRLNVPSGEDEFCVPSGERPATEISPHMASIASNATICTALLNHNHNTSHLVDAFPASAHVLALEAVDATPHVVSRGKRAARLIAAIIARAHIATFHMPFANADSH